ncbi:hypothetical protein CN326_03575 [Bacillus sp. AFS018417]|nr:hypothetical protein CN326_03575 [Bacillus sp. AFS018417]
MSKHIYDGILSRYLWVVRLPPQNSAKAKKLSGDKLPVKARLVRADNQWRSKRKVTPKYTIKVDLGVIFCLLHFFPLL